MYRTLALSLVIAGCVPAFAQHANPYAGFAQRQVKSLSDQQIADMEAGRGMGLAMAAELNGFPGPSHALELADRLDLTPEQHQRLRTLFEAMKAEAIPIGQRLINQETELNTAFANRAMTPEKLRLATASIGATEAELRNTHLKYHLSTAAVLTPDQIERYAYLRGYSSGTHRHEHQ